MKRRYEDLEVTLVDAGHARLAHRQIGSGPHLVFVHGWPLDGSTFAPLVETLSDGYTCHVFDLPGAGATEFDSDEDITLSRHADAIEAAIDRLGIDDYAMVAHDSGGVVARMVAARHGDRVKGLLFGNTETDGHTPWMLYVYYALSKIPGGRRLLPVMLGSRAFRRTQLGFGGCFTDPDYAEGPFFARVVEPLLDMERNRGAFALLQNFDVQDLMHLRRLHAQIDAPVLLVWGDADPWFPIAGAREMVDQFSGGAELETIPGGKLFVHEEHADVFARHARRFLARHLPAERVDEAPSLRGAVA